jgi:hypothetical protein
MNESMMSARLLVLLWILPSLSSSARCSLISLSSRYVVPDGRHGHQYRRYDVVSSFAFDFYLVCAWRCRGWVESGNAPAIFARLPAIIPSVLANVLVAISKAN